MLIVQKGTPNIYRPVAPDEAIANLKRILTEKIEEKLKEADVLVDVLKPIYDSAEKPEELEIAYILRGQKNILNRMKALVESARKEVTAFVMHPAVFQALKESLVEAREKRKVKLNIAVTKDVFDDSDLSGLGEVRLLCCSVGVIISDMKTLLTLSDWADETASLTQDQNLIQVARNYYDNPKCCKNVR
jgi:sugar-specific transcriptional regulator TrmB